MKGLLTILISTALLFSIETDKVKNLYDSGYYSQLINYTDSITGSGPDYNAVMLYRGLAFYKIRDFRGSKRILEALIEVCNCEPLKDTALYYTALSKIKLGENVEGAVILTRLMNSSSQEISENSRSVLENLIYYKLEDADYKDINARIFDKEVSEFIDRSSNALKILAVLPTTGIDQEAGKDILTGLEFGLKKLGTKHKNLRLDVVNSEGKIAVMTKKVIEKLNSTRYNLIIGELRSDATAALAGIAELKKIPLVSPTASAKEISEISDQVFQLNTTSYTFGKQIAEYAIDSLGYKTFAILSPLTEDGNESVSGFTSKVVEKGCSVIALEWYFESYDLNKQIQRIREKVMSIDSLDTEEYMSTDSLKAVPAGKIDAFFLPVPDSDTESVLSQVSYYNFTANTLGTYGWNDEKILNKLNANADSLVFIKESSYNIENSAYTDFAYKFRNEFNRNPKYLEILGYSIMDMLVSLKDSNPDRSVYKILSDLKNCETIYGKMIWKDSRSNSASELYMYRNGKGLRKLNFTENDDLDSLTNAKKFYNTAYVNEITRHYEKAALNYEKALSEYKNNLTVSDSLFENDRRIKNIVKRTGEAYFILGDYSKATSYFDRYLAVDPEDLQVRFKNDVSKANIDPDISPEVLSEYTYNTDLASDAYFEMGNMYLKMNEIKKAMDYFSAASELKNKNADKILKQLREEEKKNNENKFEW